MASQHPLQVVDVAFLDGALGHHHAVHLVKLVQGRGQRSLDQIEVEPAGSRKLEVAKRLLAETAD